MSYLATVISILHLNDDSDRDYYKELHHELGDEPGDPAQGDIVVQVGRWMDRPSSSCSQGQTRSFDSVCRVSALSPTATDLPASREIGSVPSRGVAAPADHLSNRRSSSAALAAKSVANSCNACESSASRHSRAKLAHCSLTDRSSSTIILIIRSYRATCHSKRACFYRQGTGNGLSFAARILPFAANSAVVAHRTGSAPD